MFPVLFPFFMRHGSVKAADNINTAGSRIELYDRATGGGESIMYTYIYILPSVSLPLLLTSCLLNNIHLTLHTLASFQPPGIRHIIQ